MKITKGQLRQIIREEIEKVNEYAGAFGARAQDAGDDYAQARQGRNWDAKNQAHRDREVAAAAPGKKKDRENAMQWVDEELGRAFPGLTLRATASKSPNNPKLITDFVLEQAGYAPDEDDIRQAAQAFFAGNIQGEKDNLFTKRKEGMLRYLQSFK